MISAKNVSHIRFTKMDFRSKVRHFVVTIPAMSLSRKGVMGSPAACSDKTGASHSGTCGMLQQAIKKGCSQPLISGRRNGGNVCRLD